MLPIMLGTDMDTSERIALNPDLFRTHFHLLGATGSGKTTAIHTILQPILRNPRPKACVFIVDPMGGLSQDMLRWIANSRLCPQHVRDRLVYIEPAREDVVLPFNPLIYESEDHLYYQVGRAVEIVLRAWASQNIDEMPRLRQWTFNAFFAAAAMGFPIATCRYLLRPGTAEHEALLKRLPGELQGMWAEILKARGNEAVKILESTRNRLAPFFDSGILRRMFGSFESRFDVPRLIRERRIVILNVASYERLDPHLGKTIGAMAVNEIIRGARNLTSAVVDPTYLLLDEFQNFVTPDVYEALPTVRQLGLRLMLAHQSFAQLESGDVDLTSLIWQARSRLMFANDADDADRIAHEIGTLTFDPMKLKEVLYTRKQRVAGHRKVWLKSNSSTWTASRTRGSQEQDSYTSSEGESRRRYDVKSANDQQGTARGRSKSASTSDAESTAGTEGSSQSIVPIYEEYMEISNKSYHNFDEQVVLWAQRIRKRQTGQAFAKFRDDDRVYDLQIDYHPAPDSSAIQEALEELLAKNFASDFFLPASVVEQRAEQLRIELLKPPKIEGGRILRIDDTSTGDFQLPPLTAGERTPDVDDEDRGAAGEQADPFAR